MLLPYSGDRDMFTHSLLALVSNDTIYMVPVIPDERSHVIHWKTDFAFREYQYFLWKKNVCDFSKAE